MSDRVLIAGATLPMLGAVAALVLLQRMPGVSQASARAETSPAPREAATPANVARWTGVVVARNTAELAAEADGRVESVFVRTGQHVRAGERLLQFDRVETVSSVAMASAELDQRRSELARTQARAQAAQDQWKRLRAAETWLSRQELDTAAAEARVAEAEMQAARANLGLSKLAVNRQRLRANRQLLVAPFAGTVVALGVDAGDSVTAGQIVLRILSDGLQVNFAFPPQDRPDPESSEVSIRLAGSEYAVRARIAAVRPELDPSAELVFATAPLPAALPERERWLAGAPVEVTLAQPVEEAAP